MNNSIKQERLDFLCIDQQTQPSLTQFKPAISKVLHQVIDRFYEHVLSIPLLKVKMGDSQNISRLKNAQAKHWDMLFNGNFDEAYARSVQKIGYVHVDAGIQPKWYIGGYCFVLNHLVDLAIETYKKDPKKLTTCLKSVNQAIFLDMDIALSTYMDTIISQIQSNAETVSGASELLQNKAEQMENSLNTMVVIQNKAASEMEVLGTTIQSVASANTQSSDSIEKVANSTNSIEGNIQSVADATEKMSLTINNIASAMEQMSVSLSQVSQNASQAAIITNKATLASQAASEIMGDLGESAKEIGSVVNVIKGIATQTNLLALNATIEAARAGEAGKGFGVVASEVKTLANQSAESSENIRLIVEKIQFNITKAIESIEDVSSIISSIDQINSLISKTVAEQTGTSQEISQNVITTANVSGEISRSVAHVSESTINVARNIDAISTIAHEVSNNAKTGAQQATTVNGSITALTESALQATRDLQETKLTANNLSELAIDLQKLVQKFST